MCSERQVTKCLVPRCGVVISDVIIIAISYWIPSDSFYESVHVSPHLSLSHTNLLISIFPQRSTQHILDSFFDYLIFTSKPIIIGQKFMLPEGMVPLTLVFTSTINNTASTLQVIYMFTDIAS